MRTTIRIDDELYRAVKERAASTNRTVAAVIEDAVRVGLAPPEREERPGFDLKATGSGGLRPGVDLASNASVREALDEGKPLDALR